MIQHRYLLHPSPLHELQGTLWNLSNFLPFLLCSLSLHYCFSMSFFFSPFIFLGLFFFYHFLKVCYPRGTTILAHGLSCAQWCVLWTWLDPSVFGMGQPLASHHRGCPCRPLLPTPGHLNPIWKLLFQFCRLYISFSLWPQDKNTDSVLIQVENLFGFDIQVVLF